MSYTTLFIILIAGICAVLMMLQQGWFELLGALLALGSLGYCALKVLSSRRQQGDLEKLRAAYEQLDQQAKLIIRTDLELHHAQEELDRRLGSLMSLHQLGRQLQVSPRPEEVYQKLDSSIVTHFGFSVGLLGACPTLDALEWRSVVNADPALAERVKDHLISTGLLKSILTQPRAQMLRRSESLSASQKALLDLLGCSSMAVAAIIPHSGPAGCLILCQPGVGTSTSKADQELVSILANQLVTAVENSSLYERAWAAQHELEGKIQQRTRELADANATLLRLNKAKSDFVSAVSHELRTPLAAIKGYASLLNAGQFGPLAQAQAERLGKIEKHADLLAQFINNLLDIARIESGRITMENRPIKIDEFLAGIQELVQPQLQQHRLTLALEHAGVKELFGDPQHLQRVFINLLSNAIKYTPDAGSIRLSFEQGPSSAIIAKVSDTGYGIPAEDLPKLFQEFFRANDPINQQIRGTGLGLTLVRRIVEAHHGTIAVESTKGKGTTFTLTLPAGGNAAELPEEGP